VVPSSRAFGANHRIAHSTSRRERKSSFHLSSTRSMLVVMEVNCGPAPDAAPACGGGSAWRLGLTHLTARKGREDGENLEQTHGRIRSRRA
jgi:hypothetical protein